VFFGKNSLSYGVALSGGLTTHGQRESTCTYVYNTTTNIVVIKGAYKP